MKIQFNFNDKRLCSRADLTIKKILESPSLGFPQLFSESGELQGFYRLINNHRASLNNFLDPIIDSTVQNSLDQEELLILHDTTKIKAAVFEENLHLHLSLAVNCQRPYVYGAVGLSHWDRGNKIKPIAEHERWFNSVTSVEKLYQKSPSNLIHIMDREGDSFHNLSNLISEDFRFIIRLCHDRKFNGESLKHTLQGEEVIAEREVFISKRNSKNFVKSDKIHPPRKSRFAQLSIKSGPIRMTRTGNIERQGIGENYPKEIKLNGLCVEEINPPDNESRISWFLLTSEKITTAEQALKVVDYYRRRWLIEEYFKGLKSGCRIEARQFDDTDSWVKMLSFFLAAAATILNLRIIEDQKEIDEVLSEIQIKILGKLSLRYKMKITTANEILLVIARLGGHIKWSGPPGWSTLMKGMKEIITLEKGWLMAKNKM
jgi:hypothetical protein